MTDFNPDSNLIALRAKIEQWLIDQGEYWDTDRELAANNITLWAATFMRVTEEDAEKAADRLRSEGANYFVERVQRSAQSVFDVVPSTDPKEAVASAYAVEVIRLRDL